MYHHKENVLWYKLYHISPVLSLGHAVQVQVLILTPGTGAQQEVRPETGAPHLFIFFKTKKVGSLLRKNSHRCGGVEE